MEGFSPRIGLALSGGGARGLAHIGVLSVLEREKIPVDYLSGTSMGGLIAAGYAAGLSPEQMEQEALRMGSLRRVLALADPSLPRSGLLEGKKVQEYLVEQIGHCTFDDLRIPLTLVAVDLNAGKEVHLHQGRVADAVRATVALPGVFKPVERDGQMLVDGGVLNHLPSDVARQMGANIVIAVDVSVNIGDAPSFFEALQQRRYLPSGLVGLFEVLYLSQGIMMKELHQRRLAESSPEIIIRPAIAQGVTMLGGFPRAAEIIAAGEEAAMEVLSGIQALLPPITP